MIYIKLVICALATSSTIYLTACDNDPAATQRVEATSGADLYSQNCAECHGSDLRGTAKGPGHLNIAYEPAHHNDDEFRSAVADGVCSHHWNFGDMPPVEGLSDAEVNEIIKFVRENQVREGFEYEPEMDHHGC